MRGPGERGAVAREVEPALDVARAGPGDQEGRARREVADEDVGGAAVGVLRGEVRRRGEGDAGAVRADVRVGRLLVVDRAVRGPADQERLERREVADVDGVQGAGGVRVQVAGVGVDATREPSASSDGAPEASSAGAPSAPPARLTRLVSPVVRSWIQTRCIEAASPRFPASDPNATFEPSALIAGSAESSSPGWSPLRLANVVPPRRRGRRPARCPQERPDQRGPGGEGDAVAVRADRAVVGRARRRAAEAVAARDDDGLSRAHVAPPTIWAVRGPRPRGRRRNRC